MPSFFYDGHHITVAYCRHHDVMPDEDVMLVVLTAEFDRTVTSAKKEQQ
jgi:hypothetical protein